MAISWLDYFQLALNFVLITLLAIFAFRKKPLQTSQFKEACEKTEALAHSLTEIAKEHETIAKQFEVNLEIKRRLIQELITQLEQRITEAKETAEYLEQLLENAKDAGKGTILGLKNPEHERIIQLANKGFTIQSIAQQVQKSVGEVELIINLYKASLKKKSSK